MKQFWLDALERAIKTAAQTAVASIGTAEMMQQVNWQFVASTVALATVLSLLTSIGSKGITGKDSASLIEQGSGSND